MMCCLHELTTPFCATCGRKNAQPVKVQPNYPPFRPVLDKALLIDGKMQHHSIVGHLQDAMHWMECWEHRNRSHVPKDAWEKVGETVAALKFLRRQHEHWARETVAPAEGMFSDAS